MRKPRLTPREKVAGYLRELGYDVEAEDIHHVHGGAYKVLSDVVECWYVLSARDAAGKQFEIRSAETLTECARYGITISLNRPDTCLYGDLIASSKRPKLARKWGHIHPNTENPA